MIHQNLRNLTDQESETTSETGKKKMRLSSGASSMVFKMFTSGVYSNPIGTVVREITSNCFDSHVEAGVNTPVILKKEYVEAEEMTYISFIDFGMGMSPDRVENIYGVYFESTKRDTNDQIGGFGIGGKTPLAYKRSTGQGEGEYDNSFFVITTFNGMKYIYNIFEGAESPEFALLHQEKTEDRNGTEIRIPVLEKDISRFEDEIIRQLYYFENLIFEGFSENITNNYQIIRGERFLYRGTGLGNKMHLCLGRVAYPINFDLLGLDARDFAIPVAIKAPIGSINPTTSREELDYSESAITYLKKEVELVKEELKGMLTKQHKNVRTLEDYYRTKKQFGYLYLSDTVYVNITSIFNMKEIKYTNYKFRFMDTPDDVDLFKKFFNVRRFGKKEAKTYKNRDAYHDFQKGYTGLQEADNVFFCFEPNTKLRRLKQSYLRETYGRFYLITPKDLDYVKEYDQRKKFAETFEYKKYEKQAEKIKKGMFDMQEQYIDIVRKYAMDYLTVEVPEGFKPYRAANTLSKDILNKSIVLNIIGGYKKRITIKQLREFNGVIFFGGTDDAYRMRHIKEVFQSLYGNNHIAKRYETSSDGWDGRGVMFVTVAKNNLKYFDFFKKAMSPDRFYYKMVHRKEVDIKTYFKNYKLISKYNAIADLYRNADFHKVSPEWAKTINETKDYIKGLKTMNSSVLNYESYFNKFFDLGGTEPTKEEVEMSVNMELIMELQYQNHDVLKYVSTPWSTGSINDEHAEVLKKVMSF